MAALQVKCPVCPLNMLAISQQKAPLHKAQDMASLQKRGSPDATKDVKFSQTYTLTRVSHGKLKQSLRNNRSALS